MPRYRRAFIVIALVVVAGATPLFKDILELPKYVYMYAFKHSSSVSLQAYGFLTQLLQYLSIQLIALSFFSLYVLFRLWKLVFSPLNYQSVVGDTGYINDGFSKKETANIVQRRRRLGDIPPVFPNGWFLVMLSADLAVKEVKYVTVLGEHLAIFRGEDGVAYILDAYCPHLGANIAIGGQVKDDCIQCPFHGWRFHGDSGVCVEIPYTKCIPQNAKVKSWHALEKNQRIYMWYHAEGIEPDWEPELIEGIGDGSWSYGGKTVHYIDTHIQDLPENGGDVNHLTMLHVPLVTCGNNLNRIFNSTISSLGYHEWQASWEQDEERKHCAVMTVVQKVHIFGYHIPFLDFHVKARQIGPGIVYLRWSFKLGSGVFIHEVTPVEPMVQKLTQAIYSGSTIPNIVAKFLLYSELTQLERDIMVWNYKTYNSKPLLVKEDQTIRKHRKWYQQFYSENSPRLTLAKNNNMEW